MNAKTVLPLLAAALLLGAPASARPPHHPDGPEPHHPAWSEPQQHHRRDVRPDDRHDRDDRHHPRARHDDRRDGGHAGTPPQAGWSRVRSYTAGGSAKETGSPSSGPIRKIRIVATSGSVIVNTLVVREGSSKTPHRLAVRLAAGESREIDLGSARRVTGLRISDGGKGTYEIQVR